MNTKTKHVVPVEESSADLRLDDRQDIDHPTIFADQLSALGIGPFVSKFTLSIENHGQKQRVPIMTVTMPTNALYKLALNIFEALGQDATQQRIKMTQDNFLKQLEIRKLEKAKK